MNSRHRSDWGMHCSACACDCSSLRHLRNHPNFLEQNILELLRMVILLNSNTQFHIYTLQMTLHNFNIASVFNFEKIKQCLAALAARNPFDLNSSHQKVQVVIPGCSQNYCGFTHNEHHLLNCPSATHGIMLLALRTHTCKGKEAVLRGGACSFSPGAANTSS